MYFRCWQKGCRAALRTNVFAYDLQHPNPIIQIFHNDEHEHNREDDQIRQREIINDMKDQARSIPHDINQGQINGTFAQTFLGERYLFHLDNAIGVAIFATDFELRQIANSATIYIDGAFKTAPAPYRQIFTIHCEFMDRVIPLAVALLTGKTQQHYDTVINSILQGCRQLSGNNIINIQSVVSDFEQAIINAVRVALPNARLCGCYFHFAQNPWKHLQDLGLKVAYGNDIYLKKCLRLCFCLGFLPLANVGQQLNLLIADVQTQALILQYPRLQDFFIT